MVCIDQSAPVKRRSQLSLAVFLRDGYSGGRPLGVIELFLDGNEKPTLNPSGYYTFLDLSAGRYHVMVISDNYLDEKVMVDIKTSSYTVEEIKLTPRPCYPFPPAETLVRGTLRDSYGPIAGALLKGSLHASSFSSRTDENGQFVIFFGALDEEDEIYLGYPDTKDHKREIPITVEYRSRDGCLVQVEERLSEVAVGITSFVALKIAEPVVLPIKCFEERASSTGETIDKGRSYEMILPHGRRDLIDIFEIEWEDLMS